MIMSADLVQPIAVTPCGHEETILAAALASAGLLGHATLLETSLGHRTDEDRWQRWLGARFTKSVRRIRRPVERERVNQLAAQELPALTVHVGKAVATAFEPMSYLEYPRELKRLQVSGLDIARRPDNAPPAQLTSPGELRPRIILNQDVTMSTGKSAAQAAHALGLWALALSPEQLGNWLALPSGLVSYEPIDLDEDDDDTIVIRDSGLTEIPPNTITAAIALP